MKILISILKLVKYAITLMNQIKKLIEELTKKSLIDNLSRKLLELEFEESHSIKSKCLKYIVKEILPTL